MIDAKTIHQIRKYWDTFTIPEIAEKLEIPKTQISSYVGYTRKVARQAGKDGFEAFPRKIKYSPKTKVVRQYLKEIGMLK